MARDDITRDVEQVWQRLRRLPGERTADFERLIRFRVLNILFVASLYDAFTLEEGGRLTELILSDYRELNLSSAPHLTRALSGEEALELIRDNAFDLVITMTRIGGMGPVAFARQAKALDPDLPVMVLGFNERELEPIVNEPDSAVDRAFIWSGDARLLLAIVKQVEDRRNVDEDTRQGDVRVILLIEDSVRFYSSYLPLLYTEVMRQTHELMADSVNLAQKLLRMRARPKILLAASWEEAWDFYTRYREYILGVISDARFPRGGRKEPHTGVDFIRRVKEDDPQLPTALQSSEAANRELAREVGAVFLDKESPTLLEDLRRFLREHFGFGDFVFRLPDGTEVGRAENTRALLREIARVPGESLWFHASHDHFSNWFRARTKFRLANMLKPLKVSEFESTEELRRYLVETIGWYRAESQRGMVADFSRRNFDASAGFVRIGTGSLGGKGRGLAFMDQMLNHAGLQRQFPEVELRVPPTAVIATDHFDAFLEQGELRRVALDGAPDAEIAGAFLAADLPPALVEDLRAFLAVVDYPLAVRSSSLLEDAQHQPFAGVYRTYMIPNNHPDPEVRLRQLCDAVKLVYASTYYEGARQYLAAIANRIEEEKMAVVLQQVVGRRHEHYVYPDMAGVAHSTNHYPTGKLRPEDGVAMVALGLGRMVVEGGQCLRFSPRAPQRLYQFTSVEETLRNSQRELLALDVGDPDVRLTPDEMANVVRLDLAAAERHGTLQAVGSVYSPENDAIYEGLGRKGPRLVTFAPVLKSEIFPLARILEFLLELTRRCLNCAVEIEFAATLVPEAGQRHTFGVLQVRPLAAELETPPLPAEALDDPRAVIATDTALGNGRYTGIADIVYVDPDRFDRGRTPEIAAEVGEWNRRLQAEGRPYLLIGFGRWGSSDRWLGIPVQWAQISGARVIVEADRDDFRVTPSQGTHFFQNLTSFRVGYLTVGQGHGRIDWDWLRAQPPAGASAFLRHVRLARPLEVLVDGRHGRAVVLAPQDET